MFSEDSIISSFTQTSQYSSQPTNCPLYLNKSKLSKSLDSMKMLYRNMYCIANLHSLLYPIKHKDSFTLNESPNFCTMVVNLITDVLSSLKSDTLDQKHDCHRHRWYQYSIGSPMCLSSYLGLFFGGGSTTFLMSSMSCLSAMFPFTKGKWWYCFNSSKRFSLRRTS